MKERLENLPQDWEEMRRRDLLEDIRNEYKVADLCFYDTLDKRSD